MPNLLDLMKPKDRQRMVERFEKRMEPDESRGEHSIPTEVYIVSELGYYYGWDAIMAVRDNKITLEEVYAFVEGAKKVRYANLIDDAHAQVIANQTAFSKNPGEVFSQGMNKFVKRVNERH